MRVTALLVACAIGCHPDAPNLPDAAPAICAGSFLPSATRLRSVAHADFNGDGIVDLVSTGDAGIGLLMGLADGSFGEPRVVTTGLKKSIAVADFDADGDVDVLVTGFASQTTAGVVSWFGGNGDGTFGPERAVVAFDFPQADPTDGANHLAVGDLDGDSRADVVLVARDGIHLLIGNGDGTFRDAATYAVGRYASEVVIADFNQDGLEDILVADPGYHCINYADLCDPEVAGGLYLLVGRGSVTFELTVIDPDIRDARGYPGGPTSVSVADLDHDGAPDIVTGNYAAPTTVFLGHRDGSFDVPVSLANMAGLYVETALADLDLDGTPDLVELDHPFRSGLVLVWHGRGDGSFSSEADHTYAPGGELVTSKLDTATVGADHATNIVVTSSELGDPEPHYGLRLLPATCFQQ